MAVNIVLGGTSGLGAELANGLREKGEPAFVIGSTYTPEANGEGMAVDLLQDNDVQRLTDRIAALGDTTIRRFFWTAGIGYNGDFSDQPNVADMVRINLAAGAAISQKVWSRMLEQTGPSDFIVVSSTTGLTARTNEAVYSLTKFGQVGFTRSLGLEAERIKSKIKVVLFEPGGIKTPFWDKNPQGRPEKYDTFHDPRLLAKHMLAAIDDATGYFYEEKIPTGSLWD